MGIAEQNSVTVSAGMAYMGKKVFTIGPASFYSMRSAEQVKVDVAYSHNNVTVIRIAGGISYGALGATHHSLQDISLMRAIPGLTVMLPSDAVQDVKDHKRTSGISETNLYQNCKKRSSGNL